MVAPFDVMRKEVAEDNGPKNGRNVLGLLFGENLSTLDV